MKYFFRSTFFLLFFGMLFVSLFYFSAWGAETGTWAYGKPRVRSLEEEVLKAQELKDSLARYFGSGKIPIHRNHWWTVVKAYVYGGYTPEEIADTICVGPAAVHPSIPASAWRRSADYQTYQERSVEQRVCRGAPAARINRTQHVNDTISTENAPPPPLIRSLTPVACNAFWLQWDPVEHADAYEIFRNASSLGTVGVNVAAYLDTDLAEQTQYTYAVRALNIGGVSDFSQNSITGITTVCPKKEGTSQDNGTSRFPPDAPFLLNIVSVGCNQLSLTWKDVPGAEMYQVFRGGTLLTSIGRGQTTFLDTDLAEDAQYRYSVRAENAAGTSPSSRSLSAKTGRCTATRTADALTGSTVSSTQGVCSTRGGTSCQSGEACPSYWLDTPGDDRCCSTACIPRVAGQACNDNSVCEPSEVDTCADCQCSAGGVICRGICYAGLAKDAVCRDGTLVHKSATTDPVVYCFDLATCVRPQSTCLLPSPCFGNVPFAMTVDLPHALPIQTWKEGTIRFENYGTTILPYILYTVSKDITFEINRTGSWELLPTELNLNQFAPGHPVTYPLRAKIAVRTDGFTSIHQLKQATLGIRWTKEGVAVERTFWGVDQSSAQHCGGTSWNVSGQCTGSVFTLDGSCRYGADCLGRIPKWKTFPATYPAQGMFRVLFIPTDLSAAQQNTFNESFLQNIGSEVRSWYNREAMRIVGKQMVDFQFSIVSPAQLNLPDAQFQFLHGTQTIRAYLTQHLPSLDLSQYHFIVLVVPSIPVQASVGEAAGLYLGDGVITMKADTTSLTASGIAHEFAHGFGCQDLWMGGKNRYFMCNYQNAGHLMCGAETFTPEIVWFRRATVGYANIEYRTLGNCAAEMGWGDVDDDGVLDVEDTSIFP